VDYKRVSEAIEPFIDTSFKRNELRLRAMEFVEKYREFVEKYREQEITFT